MWLILLIPVIFIFGILLIGWFLQLLKYRNLNVPGPKPLPIIGNILEFGFKAEEILENLNKLADKYGGIFKLYLGPGTVTVVLTDPKYIKPILNSSVNLSKTSFYDLYSPFIGTGLVVAKAEVWKRNRKVISSAFRYSMFEEYNKVFNTASENIIITFKDNLEKPLDMYHYFTLWSLDIIGETSMGLKFNEDYSTATKYLHDVNEVFKIVMERAFSFHKRIDFIFQFLPDFKVQQKYIKSLHDFTDNIIKKRMQVREAFSESDKQDAAKNATLLDCLLQFTNNGKDVPISHIRQEIDTFIIAGHDTITVSMSCLLFVLSKHPEIQEKIFEEVKSILDDKDIFITLQQQNEMKYLDMVIKESLRLHSAVPFIERYLEQDVEIDGLVLPKGTNVNVLIYAMHRSERNYHDPLKFDPERFSPENHSDRESFDFIPFSLGPRMCIGYKFAMYQMKCVLAKLVREFQFIEADPNFKLELYNDAVLKSRNGFPIILRKRE